MSFIYKSFSCFLAYTLILTCNLVSSDDIPAILWNIKGNSLHIKPVSALGHSDETFVDTLKDILHQEASIVVFTVNKLSLEDFSANDKPFSLNNTLYNVESFLDYQQHVFFTSVKDPLNYIHKAHCGVQEIVVDNKVDESIIQSVSSAIQRSCVVILHISDEGVVTKEGELKSIFLPSFDSSNKNIVGIFTGVKSSWGSPNNDHHAFRHLLQANVSDDNFVNTSCVILYAENAMLQLSKKANDTVKLPFPVKPSVSCGNTSSIFELTFKPSGSVSSVVIKFNFTRSRGAWITKGIFSISGDEIDVEELDLASESVGAPIGFSYSCGDLVLRPKNISYEYSIKMTRFQVQPFEIKQSGFSDSFDCVTFFTIPIWMGIFVALIFIAIINIGVYALFSVHTMDRFDDPKGKTITISATAD